MTRKGDLHPGVGATTPRYAMVTQIALRWISTLAGAIVAVLVGRAVDLYHQGGPDVSLPGNWWAWVVVMISVAAITMGVASALSLRNQSETERGLREASQRAWVSLGPIRIRGREGALLDLATNGALRAARYRGGFMAATAVGNHEFDKGWLDLQNEIQRLLDAPVLGANVYEKGTTKPVLDEYAMLEASGLKVAVIGTVTQETPTLVTPSNVAMLDFGDPVDAVNRVVADLNALPEGERPDLIVAEYHEGASDDQGDDVTLESEMAESPVFAKIVKETSPDVDVIFNGHTHRTYAWEAAVPGDDSRTRPVVQTGSYGAGIGQVVLNVDPTDGTVVSYIADVVPITDKSMNSLMEAYPDPLNAIYDIVLAAEQNALEKGSEVVGELTAPITRAYTNMVLVDGVFEKTEASAEDRGEASAMGTLVGNALRASLADLENAPDFGILNPGGLRTDFYPNADGEITMSQAMSVLPFNNELTVVTMTGQQLIDILGEQWQRTLDGEIPGRAYLQLGLSDNVQYTYSVVADPDHDEGQLGIITSVMIDGVPVDPEATYRAGTFSFLSAGGDNFHTFKDTDVMETGRLDWEGWVAYLQTSLDGDPIAPDFARQGVELEGLTSGTLTVGEEVTVTMSRTDVFSVGSPANTEAYSWFAGLGARSDFLDIGTSRVADGSTTVTFTVPEMTLGEAVFGASFEPSETFVSFPVVVKAAEGGEGEKPGTGEGQKPGTKPGGSLPVTGASVLVTLLAAAALTTSGVAVKSRRRQ